GVATVESRSVSGVSVVKLYFREDTDPNAALTMTNSLAAGARAYLPTNTLPPVVLPFDPTGTLPLGHRRIADGEYDEGKGASWIKWQDDGRQGVGRQICTGSGRK